MRTAAAMLVAVIWTSNSAAYDCPSFVGREWEFTGHLVNRITPGQPDYESVTSGDDPITRWYLQLPWPICFEEHRHEIRFQLVLTPQEVDRYRQFLGKQITVRGTLEEGPPGYTTALVVKVTSLVKFQRGGS